MEPKVGMHQQFTLHKWTVLGSACPSPLCDAHGWQ